MEAWAVRMEAERAKWRASKGGIATMALAAAAAKAGFAKELEKAGIEVFVSFSGGEWWAHLETEEPYWYEREEPGVWPYKAIEERARKWLRAYGAAKGWKVSG